MACHATWAIGASQSGSNEVPACPAIAQIESAPDIDTLRQMLKALPTDMVNDDLGTNRCDPPLNSIMAMKRAAPLCRILGVDTSAIALAYVPIAQPVRAPVPAVFTYMLPYTDDAYQSIVAHLREAGFERVEHDPYPELTFRKKFPSWEANDFYRHGEVYARLLRDTDFKHFTVEIGGAATIRLISKDLNSCN